MEAGSWLVALISVIGGGIIVPLALAAIRRRKPEERAKAAEREDNRTAKAAAEAVDAVRDVLKEMRQARDEDKELLAVQQGEIAALHTRTRELADRVEALAREHQECIAREEALRRRVEALGG